MLKDSNNFMQGFCFFVLFHANVCVWERSITRSHCVEVSYLRQLPPTLWHIYQCIQYPMVYCFLYCKYVSLISAVVRNFIPYFKLKTIENSRKRTKNTKLITKPLTKMWKQQQQQQQVKQRGTEIRIRYTYSVSLYSRVCLCEWKGKI